MTEPPRSIELAIRLRQAQSLAGDEQSQQDPTGHWLRRGNSFLRLRARMAASSWPDWAEKELVAQGLAENLAEVTDAIAAFEAYRLNPVATRNTELASQEAATPAPLDTTLADDPNGYLYDWPLPAYPDDVYVGEAWGIWAARTYTFPR